MKVFLTLLSIVLLIGIVTGCGSPAIAESGDLVKVYYTGKLADGTIFDKSVEGEPLEFEIGQGQVIPGFEQAVAGMQVGEAKTITIPVDQAYGPIRDDLIVEVSRDQLPSDIVPEVGMQLTNSQNTVTIIEVSETMVKIDANHPLAGKDLTFDIELLEIAESQSYTAESGLTSMPLEQALENGLPTIAELGSSSCVPCKQMKPLLEELATEYKGKLNVVIIDIYDNEKLAQQYGIMAIPTQVVFDSDGDELTRHIGFWPREEIIAQITEMDIE